MYTNPMQSEAANGARHASAEKPIRAGGSGLKNEFKDLITDIEELVMQTASLTGDELSLVREKLAERLETAKESLQEMGGDMAKRARKTAAATNEYVHEQPWKAIGIGATVGLLLGVVLARR